MTVRAESERAPVGVVLAAVRDLAPMYFSGVPVHAIRNVALDYGGVRYDKTHRVLNDLIDAGLVVKVRRGYYAPAGSDHVAA